MLLRSLIALLLVSLPALAVRADVFHLAGGGRIEGELLNPDEIPRTQYKVQTRGGVVTLARKQVERVENASAAEREYQRLRVTMAPTVEGHWTMAEFCRSNNLLESRAFHLGEILKLDPDHAEARYGLGYSKVKDRWVKEDEYRRERGYVLDRGRWRIPQELVIEQREREFVAAQGEWRKKLRMWRSWLDRKRSAEGRAEIQAVDDWRAAKPAAELLDKETTSAGKRLWIDVLGKLHTHDAWTALVKYALEDEDESIRLLCLDKLAQSGTGAAVPVFLRALDDDDNQRVNNAGIALGRMQDPHAVPALIEHLVTKHKIVQPGSSSSPGGLGPIGATFGSGGTGLNTGSGPKVVEVDVLNSGVLNALNALTGERFNTTEEWREWYVEAHTPAGVNLRRRD